VVILWVVRADFADLGGFAMAMGKSAVILVVLPRQAEGAFDQRSAVVGVVVFLSAPFAHGCEEARLLYTSADAL
jgi:hypothetical protein